MSKEEKEKIEAAEKLRKDRIGNLESLLGYSGAKFLKGPEAPYGARGVQAGTYAFNEFLTGDYANNLRKEIYNAKFAESQKYETISAPEYTSNYELEMNAMKLIESAQMGLKLKDLAGIVKKLSPGLKVEISKELEDSSFEDIQKKSSNPEYKPGKKDQAFVAYFKSLTGAYKEFAGYSLLGSSMTQGFNSLFKQLGEEFAPKKEENSEVKVSENPKVKTAN